MFDLEKLQENPQEAGEKFAHLVTFKNTYGFNGRKTRLSLPRRFAKKIVAFNSNAKIKFNEKEITLPFLYKPLEDPFRIINEFSQEIKENKKFFKRFKPSNETIRLQIFPKADLDGSLISWYNVKLKGIENSFVETERNNLIETTFTFSFSKIDFKYSSPASYESKESIEHSRKIFENFISNNISNDELESKWEKQRELMDNEIGKSACYNSRLAKQAIIGEELDQYELINVNDILTKLHTTSISIDEEICETNESEKSKDKPTE
jgi:hypothetical protein